MELEDFKNLYKKKDDALPLKSKDELSFLVKKKSSTAIEKVIRNLRMELIAGTILCVVLSIFVLQIPGSYILPYLTGLVIIFMVLQTIAYIPVFRKFKHLHDNNQASTRVWLKSLIDYLEKFIKLYLKTMMVSIPIGALFGGIIGFNAGSKAEPDPVMPEILNSNSPVVLVSTIIIALLALAGSYFFLKLVVNYLYGRHLQSLKNAYEELEE